MAFKRYVEVPAEKLLAKLTEIGQKVEKDGGRFTQRTVGREVVVDLVPRNAKAMVTIYTSLAEGAEAARDCGEDAIRLNLGVQLPTGYRTLSEPQKILRTAPASAEDRVQAFLERLTNELRGAFKLALSTPSCPLCSLPMVVRSPHSFPERKFYGCIGYPECQGTRPMPKK